MAFFPGMMFGPEVGNAVVKVGADFRGLGAQTTAAMAQFRAQMAAGAAGINQGTANAAKFNQQLDQSVKKASRLGLLMRGAAIAIGTFTIAGAGLAIKAAMDFESAFAGVRKTVDASEAELKKLERAFRDLALTVPTSVNELARIGEAAGALGVATEDILEFTKVVSTIGQTTDVSVDDAATALGQLSNVMGLTSDEYGRFAATLVDLGNKGASTESQILEITRRMGAAAKLFGISTQNTLGLASSAANLGMLPQLAASSMQRLIMRLNQIVGGMTQLDAITNKAGITQQQFMDIVTKGGDKLENLADKVGFSSKELKKMQEGVGSLQALQEALGVSGKEFDRLKRQQPEKIIEGLFAAMNQMDAAGRQTFIGRILGPAASAGGGVGMQQLMLGLADSIGRNLTPSLKTATLAWEQNTAAVEEAEKRYGTTASQLGLVKNTMQEILITVGTEMLPFMRDIILQVREALPGIFEQLGKFWQAIEPALQRVGDAASALFGTIMDIIFNWGQGGAGQSVIDGFGLLANAIETAANWIATFLEALNGLLANPVIGGLAKMLALWTGIAIAIKAIGAFRNFAVGLGSSAASFLSMGRYGGRGVMDPAAAAQQKAAAAQQVAADTQMRAAGLMTRAAAGGAASGALTGAAMARGGLGLGAMGAGGVMAGQTPLLLSAGALTARSQAAMRAMQARSLASRAGAALSGLRGLAGAAAMGVSRIFWPAFIADLVGNLVSPSIGDFIRNNTGLDRVADEWGKGWFNGIAASLQAWSRGSDSLVGLSDFVKVLPEELNKLLPEGTGMEEYIAGLTNLSESNKALEGVFGDDELIALRNAAQGAETAAEQWAVIMALADAMDKAGLELPPGLASLNPNSPGGRTMPLAGVTPITNFASTARASWEQMLAGQIREAGISGLGIANLGNLSTGGLQTVTDIMGGGLPSALQPFQDLLLRAQLGGPASFNLKGKGDPLAQWQDYVRSQGGLYSQKIDLDKLQDQFNAENERLVSLLSDVFGERGQIYDRIAEANRPGEQASLINLLLGEDTVGKTLTAKDKDLINQWWPQVLAYATAAMDVTGNTERAELADKAQGAFTEALTQELLTGKGKLHITDAAQEVNALFWDGVGKPEKDVDERIAESLVTAFASATAKARKLLAKGKKGGFQNRAEAINNLMAGTPGWDPETMGLLGPEGGANRGNTRNFIFGLIRDRVNAAKNASGKEQADILGDLRQQFPGHIPKSWGALTKGVNASEVDAVYKAIKGLNNKDLDATAEGLTNVGDSAVDANTGLSTLGGEEGGAAVATAALTGVGDAAVATGDTLEGEATSWNAAGQSLTSNLTSGINTGIPNYVATLDSLVAKARETAANIAAMTMSGWTQGEGGEWMPPGSSEGEGGGGTWQPDSGEPGGSSAIANRSYPNIAASSPMNWDSGNGSTAVNSAEQNIYIQSLALASEADEESLLAQLNFLAPSY